MALIDKLEPRDLEVLRTLVRLRYLSKRELTRLFTSDAVARRRLRWLSGLDLIRTHTKGVPERLGYFAWRATARGVDLVAQAFPDEPIRDGLVELLSEGSLYNIEHREGVSALYLDLIAGEASQPPDAADVTAVRAWARRVRARADQMFWAPDGDVALRHQVLKSDPKRGGGMVRDEQVVPDAMVAARHRRVRVFIELDRSTHGHARIRQSLERYRRYLTERYAKEYRDGRSPIVLLVTQSEQRRVNLARRADQILGQAPHAVLTRDAAVAWLGEQLFDAARLAAAAPELPAAETAATSTGATALRAVAREVYIEMHSFREALRRERKDLPTELLRTFRSLREVLHNDKEAGHAG